MAEGAAVAAIGGTLIAMEGEKKRARSEAAAARANAKAKRLQALELLDRFELNAQRLVMEGEQVKGEQALDIASKGIGVESSAALNLIEETNSLVAREMIIQRREANFKAEQLRAGADMDTQLAGDIQSASRLRRMGMFLSGGANAAGAVGGAK